MRRKKPKTVTARRAASSGLPTPIAMTTTPYHRRGGQPVWVRVTGARRRGGHIELTPERGACFLVDLMHPIFPVDD